MFFIADYSRVEESFVFFPETCILVFSWKGGNSGKFLCGGFFFLIQGSTSFRGEISFRGGNLFKGETYFVAET